MLKSIIIAKAFCFILSLNTSMTGGAVLPVADGTNFTGEYSYYTSITMDEACDMYEPIVQRYIDETDCSLNEMLGF